MYTAHMASQIDTNSVYTCFIPFIFFKKVNQYTKEPNYFNLCTKIALLKSVSDIITSVIGFFFKKSTYIITR